MAHKRGDTFMVWAIFPVQTLSGAQADLTGWTGRCQVKNMTMTWTGTVPFQWVDATLGYFLLGPTDTNNWPIGKLQFDVELTSPAGIIVSTPTAVFDLIADVTTNL